MALAWFFASERTRDTIWRSILHWEWRRLRWTLSFAGWSSLTGQSKNISRVEPDCAVFTSISRSVSRTKAEYLSGWVSWREISFLPENQFQSSKTEVFERMSSDLLFFEIMIIIPEEW